MVSTNNQYEHCQPKILIEIYYTWYVLLTIEHKSKIKKYVFYKAIIMRIIESLLIILQKIIHNSKIR